MDKTFLKGGNFDKFIVLKTEDVIKLPYGVRMKLGEVLEYYVNYRQNNGKNTENKYLVINTDEYYTLEIVEILKKNGHWG